ncbi:MAG: beta-Ala-His dipeptidase, partial [Lachnospiraceae bacterium]|nr:beta-Ala-His dipeptidase [Lachnospiraceae bacterium]
NLNIIIFKEASPGYENEPGIILQGHMDMVAVKDADCNKDMVKEPLDLFIENGKIGARGTSLGADDGIMVAYALALLESDTVSHPKLTVIITTEEETGMDGAGGIDLSMVEASKLINLDSEKEGEMIAGCAGGARFTGVLEGSLSKGKGVCFNVTVKGLLGGHSGNLIHLERGNACFLMARLLTEVKNVSPVRLVSFKGGVADNAIPDRCEASFIAGEKDIDAVKEALDYFKQSVSAELETKDKDFDLTVECKENAEELSLDEETTGKFAAYLYTMPNGVIANSMDVPGLVETSLNLGQVKVENGNLEAVYLVRSNIDSAKKALLDRMMVLTKVFGGKGSIRGNYPGWKYKVNSPLRDKMVRIYRDFYGSKPMVCAIHAGLECGILGSKLKDPDCVSIGPDIMDIHSPMERLDIESAKRVWEYLLLVLKEKG